MHISPELAPLSLEEELFGLLEARPLDDIVDALVGAFRRRATDLRTLDSGDYYLNTAAELESLKQRDFALEEFDAYKDEAGHLIESPNPYGRNLKSLV